VSNSHAKNARSPRPSRQRRRGSTSSALPLFATDGPVPVAPTPRFNPGTGPVAMLHDFYSRACRHSPTGICQASHEEIQTDTGLEPTQVRAARRKLLELGIIVIDRPSGMAPRVRLAQWPSVAGRDAFMMPIADHVARIQGNLHTSLRELGQAATILLELGDDEMAERVAGVLEVLRPAAVSLTPGTEGAADE
jgi:hypothetical protein